MNIEKKRRFLYVSNIIISVLAAAAIVGCFLLPLWKVEFSVSFTREFGDTLKQTAYAENGGGAKIRATSAGASVPQLNDIPVGMLDSFIDSLCDANFQMKLSKSFSSAEMLTSVYDQDEERAGEIIDESVDSFVEDAEVIITDLMQTAAKTAAKEAVKTGVNNMLKEKFESENENYETLMQDLGDDRERVDGLIDRVIDAIMEDGATVQSVTDVILGSADEAKEIISHVDKYKDMADQFNDESREAVREASVEMLSQFADENGTLNFKETLIQTILNTASEALEGMQNGVQDIKIPVSGMSLTTGAEPAVSSAQLIEKVKTQIKSILFNFGDGAAAKLIVTAMAVAGALLAVFLFLLFYPILRTLTNIGADNPGFGLFLPVFGGIAAYLMLVILPSIVPGVIRLIGMNGSAINLPRQVTAVLNAMSLTFSSSTVFAFAFAVILFIFSFFYAHQRRAVKKALLSSEEAQPQLADAPQPADAPEQ